MRPLKHIIASAILGIGFLLFVKPAWAALIVFLAGVFIDLDHLVDFWALKPLLFFNIHDFLDAEKYDKQVKWIFVFFHSWELIAGLWLWAVIGHWPIWPTAIAAGATLHMILDIDNLKHPYKMHPLTYFLIFRIIKKFKKANLQMCHSEA